MPWQSWVQQRGWIFYRNWQQILAYFRRGRLSLGGLRGVPVAFEGRFGDYPCFGFRVTAGSDPWGEMDVVALRIPGAHFPALTVRSVLEMSDGQHVSISKEFDLNYQATCPSASFARDVLLPGVVKHFQHLEFESIWFENDAVLMSTRRELTAEDIDQMLIALHRILDSIPKAVLSAVGVGRDLPREQATPRQPAKPQTQSIRTRTSPSSWRSWATQRKWLCAPARDIHNRLKYKLPVGPQGIGFVGKFGDYPVFGFGAVPSRQVIGIRIPERVLPVITIQRDDEVLAELIGVTNFQLGDPSFDYAWNIKTKDGQEARGIFNQRVRNCFPEAPDFSRLWFGGDSIALISKHSISPGDVDTILKWLYGLVRALPEEGT